MSNGKKNSSHTGSSSTSSDILIPENLLRLVKRRTESLGATEAKVKTIYGLFWSFRSAVLEAIAKRKRERENGTTTVHQPAVSQRSIQSLKQKVSNFADSLSTVPDLHMQLKNILQQRNKKTPPKNSPSEILGKLVSISINELYKYMENLEAQQEYLKRANEVKQEFEVYDAKVKEEALAKAEEEALAKAEEEIAKAEEALAKAEEACLVKGEEACLAKAEEACLAKAEEACLEKAKEASLEKAKGASLAKAKGASLAKAKGASLAKSKESKETDGRNVN